MSSYKLENPRIVIPNALIWMQCLVFSALYSVWMLRELMFFRRVALVAGALLALYPIYQYRSYLLQKSAIAIWLMAGLFLWTIFHLFFLGQDFAAQLMELKRIWKYVGLSAIFALGLGLSLASANNKRTACWTLFYTGLSLPILIYLLRYLLTRYGVSLGVSAPTFLQITDDSTSLYYVPKTDYIAFCLPVLALSLGQILNLFALKERWITRQYLAASFYAFVICSTLFLFYVQNTKNGIVYSAVCIVIFLGLITFKGLSGRFWYKLLFFNVTMIIMAVVLYPHLQKNDSWRTLISDTRIGFQLEEYPQWKYGGERGYPTNEYGKTVSITNYERASWFKVGAKLAADSPLGYGLVEDSFGKMTKARWPEASPNLTHSHSGWLDLILGIGFPGFFCILTALLLNVWRANRVAEPWKSLVVWSLMANLMLWITTEVSATITFSALIFWVSLTCGLTMAPLGRGAKCG